MIAREEEVHNMYAAQARDVLRPKARGFIGLAANRGTAINERASGSQHTGSPASLSLGRAKQTE